MSSLLLQIATSSSIKIMLSLFEVDRSLSKSAILSHRSFIVIILVELVKALVLQLVLGLDTNLTKDNGQESPI